MLIRPGFFINLILRPCAFSGAKRAFAGFADGAPSAFRAAGAFVLAALLLLLAGGCGELDLLSRRPQSDAAVAQQAVEKVNAFRQGQGAGALRRVAELDAVALAYGREIAASGHFAHTGVNGDHLEDRLKRAGINGWNIAGENLALSRNSDGSAPADPAADALRGWQLSPGHRKNMLNPEFNRCGMAAVVNPADGTVYLVQVFLGGGGD